MDNDDIAGYLLDDMKSLPIGGAIVIVRNDQGWTWQKFDRNPIEEPMGKPPNVKDTA